MNSSIYRFTLDMHSAQSQISLPVVLNDTARKFYISLTDGGKVYHITDGCLALLRISRPTGTFIEAFCPIEQNTNIVYDFAQYTTTAIVEGLHECEVTLYGLDGGVITTARFSMIVSARVVNRDDIVTDEDWSVIDSVVLAEAERRERFLQAMGDVERAITGIDTTINEIIPPYVGTNGNWHVRGKDTGTQAQGDPGVFVGSGDMPEGYNVQIDPEGDAVPVVISVNGIPADDEGNVNIDAVSHNELTAAISTALTPVQGIGENGEGGIDAVQLNAAVAEALRLAKESGEFDGKTPVKGVDYFTEEDKAEIVSLVLAAMSEWNGGGY